MKKLSFYEQVGIVIPGAVFLFGLIFLAPELKDIFGKGGFSVGGLGIFVIISYATGHLLAVLGNLIANIYWRSKGGLPSNWIIGSNPRLLSAPQIDKIETLTRSRLGITLAPFSQLTGQEWFPVFRQLYSDVEKNGKSDRGDMFNGNYGLNRGLCAAAFALAVAFIVHSPKDWYVSLALMLVSAAYLYRMHTFGMNYAREIYNQFLLLPQELGKPTAAKKARSSNTPEKEE